MMPDFILNGQGFGQVAQTLMAYDFDHNVLRPFVGSDGRAYVTVNTGKRNEKGQPIFNAVPLTNATATLRKDDWIILDEAIIRAAKPRLRAFGDLRSAGLQFVIPNGMGKTVLEYQTQSDITPAAISMDGLRKSESDRPVYDLKNLPLPIIHKDFEFSARQIATSRNSGSPLDTTMAELAARRVAEEAEKLTLGVAASYSYGGGTIYGYTNFPQRLTKTLTDPTNVDWTPAQLVKEVLEMKLQSQQAYHYGPWKVYNSPNWDSYLDDDYSAAKGDNTLRQRIGMIDGLSAPMTLDYLDGYQILLVQQTADVARAVVGMDITTVQWESQGGLQLNFKVMAILVPQLRSDINGNTGLVHGSVPQE